MKHTAWWLLVAMTACAAASDEPEIYDSQAEHQPFTSASDAVSRMKLPEGFSVSVFASEPDVQQPIAIAFDPRGRLWVAENYSYGEAAKNFDRQLRDRIVILEDSDDDGRMDHRKVFCSIDPGSLLTSVEVGFGGVWVLAAPYLYFIPDQDGDDVPDGPARIVLDGWDADSVRHNFVNGLKWGPDGWLYGRHGIQATSFVGPPGATASQRTQLNCSIWRYHPTLQQFEVVTNGTTNPWGMDYDQHGQMFFINTVIGHLWHVVPGAHYERMYGSDFNPHLYRLMPQTADHLHWETGEVWNEAKKGITDGTSRAGGGHAHSGMMIYLGDNWPAEYRGDLFTVNLHGLRLNRDRLERHASGYVGRHAADFMTTDDPWFRAIELAYGPDGGVYIADWSDIGECHENDGVHRRSGRIYKLTYGAAERRGPSDVSQLSNAELVELQSHENEWYVRQARHVLQQRAASGSDVSDVPAALRQLYESSDSATGRLRAMWCLNAVNALDDDWLLDQLADPDEHVRAWAIRLLVERPRDASSIDSDRIAAALRTLADHDPSGLVRLYLASALQRLPPDQRWGVARGLVARTEDADDEWLNLMIWYGLEGAVVEQPAAAMELASDSQLPLVRQFIVRRLTAAMDRDATSVQPVLAWLKAERRAGVRRDILQAMRDALQGWHQAPLPTDWPAIADQLTDSGDAETQELVRELSVVFGDGRALNQLRAIVENKGLDPASRRKAIQVLAGSGHPDTAKLLQQIMSDRAVAEAAIIGLASFDHPRTAEVILQNDTRLDAGGKIAAIDTLCSRPEYAGALLSAIEDGRLDRQRLTAFHARQIRSFADSELTARLTKSWGEIRGTAEAKLQQIEALKQDLVDAGQQGQAAQGRQLFDQHCASCHVMFGQGQTIGPDLTGSNRRNLDYLLENIVDPSASVAQDFKVTVVQLDDGRVITGVPLETTDRTLTLQTQKERMVIDRNTIELQQATTDSLMPEGLFNNLSAQQIRDLVAYLMSPQQVAATTEPAEASQ